MRRVRERVPAVRVRPGAAQVPGQAGASQVRCRHPGPAGTGGEAVGVSRVRRATASAVPQPGLPSAFRPDSSRAHNRSVSGPAAPWTGRRREAGGVMERAASWSGRRVPLGAPAPPVSLSPPARPLAGAQLRRCRNEVVLTTPLPQRRRYLDSGYWLWPGLGRPTGDSGYQDRLVLLWFGLPYLVLTAGRVTRCACPERVPPVWWQLPPC